VLFDARVNTDTLFRLQLGIVRKSQFKAIRWANSCAKARMNARGAKDASILLFVY